MNLNEWAFKWAVHPSAVQDLMQLLASNDHAPPAVDPERLQSEAKIQSLVRLEAAQNGVWLTRNNVGAFQCPDTGRLIRYGLANESKAQNEMIKSADLIGFRKRVIMTTDVGSTIAQFVSRECKAEGWKYRGSKHEKAQAAWRDFINLNGGDASFVSGPGSFTK